jgi:LPXTG-site transpeptidase (sortase) family protein
MRLSRRSIIGIMLAIIGLGLGVATVTRALLYNPQPEISDQAAQAILAATSSSGTGSGAVRPANDDYPVALSIAAIGVRADVQKVGITYAGNMAVPHNYVDVGWYKYGTVPGDTGSAVIAGHVDNGFGTPAVFKRLSELHQGDDIYVTMHGGRTLHFKVTDMQIYPYQDGPLEKIFNARDAVRLNLITCAGTWIPAAKTNDKRLVVYTTLVQ